MSVEFIGYVSAREQSEIISPKGPDVDPAYIETTARLHERAGFDRALIAFHSSAPDSLLIAQHAASVTERLGLLIAHRPGFTAPTLAARQLATLDHLSRGRVAVHIITGGNDQELKADGDHLSKAERYARTDEYLTLLRSEWTATVPFTVKGRYYNVEDASSEVRPFNAETIPIYFGGASEEATTVAGRHADAYALWGESLAGARELVDRVTASAARHRRKPRFSISFRPIIGATEQQAWERAHDIEAQIIARQKLTHEGSQSGLDTAGTAINGDDLPSNVGSRRLQALSSQGDRHDSRLWTGVARLTGGRWNSTSLVGTAEQVAESLLAYYRLGIGTFLIRGFDPLADAEIYGKELIPLVRERVSKEEASLSHG